MDLVKTSPVERFGGAGRFSVEIVVLPEQGTDLALVPVEIEVGTMSVCEMFPGESSLAALPGPGHKTHLPAELRAEALFAYESFNHVSILPYKVKQAIKTFLVPFSLEGTGDILAPVQRDTPLTGWSAMLFI